MDIEILEDLSGLSVSDLRALLDTVNEAGQSLADAANEAKAGSDERKEYLENIEKLKEYKASITEAIEVATAAEEAEEAAIAEAAKAFNDPEEGDEDNAEEDAEAEAAEDSEAAAEEAPADAEAEAEVNEAEPIAAAASKGKLSVRVPNRRRTLPTEKAGTGEDKLTTKMKIGDEPVLSIRQFSELLKRAHVGAARNGDGRGMVATIERFRNRDADQIVQGPDGFRNAAIMANAKADPDLIMAAGGFCGPGEVITEIQTCGRTDRPAGARIPTINARGEYVFSRPVALDDVFSDGTEYWTGADDEAVTTAEATWKDCYHLTCGVDVTALPIAVWACFQYGTFQQWSRPEQIQAALNLFDVALARRSEALLLQRIHDLSNQYLYTPPVGESAQNALVRMVGQLMDAGVYQGRLSMEGYELWVPEALINRIITDAAIKAWVGPTLTREAIVGQIEELYNVPVVVLPDVRANALAPTEAIPAAPAPAGAAQIPCPHTAYEVLLLDPDDFRHGVDDVDVVVQTDIATARKNDKSTVLETIETTEKFGCKPSFSVLWDRVDVTGAQPDLVAADDAYCPGPLPAEYAGETPQGWPGAATTAL